VARTRRAGERRWWRRELALVAGAALVVTLGVAGTNHLGRTPYSDRPLYLATMALDARGNLVRVDVDGDVDDLSLLPGSRAVAGAAAQAAAQSAWVASGQIPGAGTRWEGMARDALLDLRTMTLADGAVLAAGSGPWRYAWPRDGAFVAVAYARTGHLDDARRVLAFYQRAQAADGTVEARYLPDGSGPPDDRAPQTDGIGWLLWALGQTVDAAPAAERPAVLAQFQPLLDRATNAAVRAVGPTGLPAPSPDYWEKRESTVTLGTAAPLLAGLRASAHLYGLLGDDGGVAAASASARRLDAAIEAGFAPSYGRYPGSGARDAAVAFLLPPFVPASEALAGSYGGVDVDEAEVRTALHAAAQQMARPGGGLAPGAHWPQDGVSWTPETALVALGAASGDAADRGLATRLLDWLDDHRTVAGSFPEKVLHDGSPAGTAPLVWTSATVLLALATLESAG